VARYRGSACARQPVPAYGRPFPRDRALIARSTGYYIRSLLGLPAGRKAALVASSLCFFHSIRSSGIHGVASSSCSCATTSLAPCMHVRMHGHGRQACKAVYQELPVKQACYARRTTAGEQSDGALRRRNSYAML